MLTSQVLYYVAAASTFIAGILHLAIIPMFFSIMPMDVTIFFLVSGLAQVFWVIPVVKKWNDLWFYVGIVGTVILIIMWLVAVPGSGHQVDTNQISIEVLQIIFIICCILIIKDRAALKVNNYSV